MCDCVVLQPQPPVVANDPAAAAASLLREWMAHEDCVERVCSIMGKSPDHLNEIFEEAFGLSVDQYVVSERCLLAKALLSQTALPLEEVANACGFGAADQLAEQLRDFCEADARQNEAGAHQSEGDACQWKAGARQDEGETKLKSAAQELAREAGEAAFTVALGYRTPFNYQQQLDFLEFRAILGVEVVRDGMYARTCMLDGCTGWIAVEHDSDNRCILLTVSQGLTPATARLVAKARRLFDTDCIPGDVASALKDFHESVDPRFQVEGIRLPCSFEPFEMSVRAIIGQQITVKAANTLSGRVAKAFGVPCPTPIPGLDSAFPGPEAFADESVISQLGELGIIQNRGRAIMLLAQGLIDGSLQMGVGVDVQANTKALLALPGIGPWTANYMLMRAFHYSDGFPAADYGVKLAFPGLKPKEIERLSQAWKPFRSYATMCTWCAPHE